MDDKREGSQVKYAVAAFVAVIIFTIIYKYALNQLHSESVNDLNAHTQWAESIHLNGLWTTWLNIPYLLWHLCVKSCIIFFKMPTEAASAFTHGFFAAFSCLVNFYLLDRTGQKLTGKDIGVAAALASGALGIVTALYVPWFNPNQYNGQFSINPIFNPTHMAVKPFGVICFMLAVDMLLAYKGKERLYFEGIKSVRVLYVLFSFFLLLSAFTKPTFMYMLLPAGVIYLLIDLAQALWKRDGSWKKVWSFMWRIACASLPAIIYLFFEYAAFYLWGDTSDDVGVAIYPFLTGWRIYSPDVSRSLRLSMAFPLWMGFTNLRYFCKSVEGRLALIGYATGTLEFSFFVETGSRFTHLNFAWPMMSGMLLFWVISTARLIGITAAPGEHKGNTAIVLVGWILLFVHFFSGLYYISPDAFII